MRHITNHTKLDMSKCLVSSLTGNKFYVRSDNHFTTTGLFKSEIFQKIGPYPVDWPVEKDFWGRSEDWYNQHVKKLFEGQVVNLVTQIPIVSPVWDDSRGGAAFIRGDKRYGEYNHPEDASGLYYRHLSNEEIDTFALTNDPKSFVDVSHPLGWNYETDINGDQVKYGQSQIMSEEDGVLI